MNPIYGEELYHYGIAGQKWGNRRFQLKNGKYTPEGLKRFYAARNAKKKTTGKNKNKKGRLVEKAASYEDDTNGMREQTENLQKHSRINEHYESAVKAHMKEDNLYQTYRERAIEDYINSHLSSYNGNRQELIDKMGDIDDYAMKYYMKDHKNDYFVKGYHATIGNKRTAEREFQKKVKELAYPYEKKKNDKKERERASFDRQRDNIQSLRKRLSNSNLSIAQKLRLKNKITKLTNSLRKQIEAYNKRNTPKVGDTNETYADKISEAAKRRYFR